MVECPLYQPNAKVIYELITGPITTPRLAAPIYDSIIHIRALALNISSMLPVMILVGIAERSPVTSLPTIVAAGESTAPINAQKQLYNTVLVMYRFFRPKDSE